MLDLNRGLAFGWLLSSLDIPQNYYSNTEFYPDLSYGYDLVSNYLFFMVLMDYSFSGSIFYGYVDGKYYYGSRLFWRLGKLIFDEDPKFFSLEYTSNLDRSFFERMFNYGEIYGFETIDVDRRIKMVRDVAKRIMSEYGNSILDVVYASSNYLYRNGSGFIERLKKFMGFDDPVEYKALLLAKMLFRKGVTSFNDFDNIHFPVNGSILPFILRCGLIHLDDEFMNKIVQSQLTFSEDYALRIRTRECLDFVSKVSGREPMVIHDFLDLFTSYCCTSQNINCVTHYCNGCPLSSFLSCGGECFLKRICKYCGSDLASKIREPSFKGNVYY
jgi:hypothetical protein